MIKNRLNKLSEIDFGVLNDPLKSGRQSPESLGGTLLLVPFLVGVFLLIGNLFVFMDRIEPAHDVVIILCISFDVVGLVVSILAIFFASKKVYKSRQAEQYLVVTLISPYIFGILPLGIALYMIFDDVQFSHNFSIGNTKMVLFIIGILVVGVMVLLFAFLRFIKRLEDGKYRRENKSDTNEGYLEERPLNFKKISIIFGIVFILVAIILLTILHVTDVETLFISSLTIMIFYSMLFILPEQFVIWYCIKRFKSFQSN